MLFKLLTILILLNFVKFEHIIMNTIQEGVEQIEVGTLFTETTLKFIILIRHGVYGTSCPAHFYRTRVMIK